MKIEVGDLLNKLNNILNSVSLELDGNKKIEIITNNLDLFEDISKNINDIANIYLIKEHENNNSNANNFELKNVIISLIKNDNIIAKVDNIQDLNLTIINTISYYENRFIFRLMHNRNLKMVYEALDYQKDREDFKTEIQNTIKLCDNSRLKKVVKDYFNNEYEIKLFENIIRTIKNNENKIGKNEIIKISEKLNKINFIKEILFKEEKNLKEKSILKEYANVIIRLKAEILPELLKDDILVVTFIKGKILDEELSIIISNAIPIYRFQSLLFALSLEDKSKIISDIKIKNLSEEEIKKIDELLGKAGIKIHVETKELEDDDNFLVSLNDLRRQYEKANINLIHEARERLYKASINEGKSIEKLSNSQRKAYLEISTIINMMTKQMKSKISPQLIAFIERNKLKKRKCDINPNIKLENQKIENEETRALLALIYKDNICSEEERKHLERLEQNNLLNNKIKEEQKLSAKNHNPFYLFLKNKKD